MAERSHARRPGSVRPPLPVVAARSTRAAPREHALRLVTSPKAIDVVGAGVGREVGVAERYERRSTALSSNLVFSEWDRIFKNKMATSAAIDRLIHHSVVLEFDVPSYRTEKARSRKKE